MCFLLYVCYHDSNFFPVKYECDNAEESKEENKVCNPFLQSNQKRPGSLQILGKSFSTY